MDYAAESKREVKSLRSRYPEKPPAGIRTDLDAMKQEKANEAGMKAHEGRRLAKGGSVTRGDGCVSKGHTKGKVI
jgi:hypothetical protein